MNWKLLNGIGIVFRRGITKICKIAWNPFRKEHKNSTTINQRDFFVPPVISTWTLDAPDAPLLFVGKASQNYYIYILAKWKHKVEEHVHIFSIELHFRIIEAICNPPFRRWVQILTTLSWWAFCKNQIINQYHT